MIYVFQDPTKIPADWLAKVKELRKSLDVLDTKAKRKAYIDSKQAVWGEIKNALLEMSHGKCWYSEAPDAVSDWHVDHFRPKLRALDIDRTEHDGYPWLAFDWRNYRIAGSFGNSPHKDADQNTRGKWDYFPLSAGSVRATWDQRDTAEEIVLLLDPTHKSDPKLMSFDEDGVPIAIDPGNSIVRKRVELTVHLLYLDSPRLIAARKKKWREMSDLIEEYRASCPDSYEQCTVQDHKRVNRLIEKLSEAAGPQAAYAATARACLKANGLGDFIDKVEAA